MCLNFKFYGNIPDIYGGGRVGARAMPLYQETLKSTPVHPMGICTVEKSHRRSPNDNQRLDILTQMLKQLNHFWIHLRCFILTLFLALPMSVKYI